MDTTLTVYIFIEISEKKKEEFQEEFYRRIKIRECRRRENLFCLIGIILVFPLSLSLSPYTRILPACQRYNFNLRNKEQRRTLRHE